MTQKGENSNRLHAVLWILLALLTLSFLTTIGVLWCINSGKRKDQTLTTGVGRSRSVQEPTSFAELNEASVAGRYRIVDGDKVSFLYLNEDHTFINKDGTTYPQYQWEVGPDRLRITYQRGTSTFTTFERVGVYSQPKPEGGMIRMEKLPDLPPAETIALGNERIVASLLFTDSIQSNDLALANSESDGALQAVEIEGQPCYQLVRQRNRMSGFLYVRIASELKQEPFTNALLTVEYFDVPMHDTLNGWISLQYDGKDGPYASTCQRVRLAGSMAWKRATFVLDAPVFEGRENDGADFRLCLAESKLPIRALKLVKNKAVP